MNKNTLHIKTPSKKLLDFARKLQEDKDRSKLELLAKKEIYFPKSSS
jgi:hypothetical protein